MEIDTLTPRQLLAFQEALRQEERAAATIQKYLETSGIFRLAGGPPPLPGGRRRVEGKPPLLRPCPCHRKLQALASTGFSAFQAGELPGEIPSGPAPDVPEQSRSLAGGISPPALRRPGDRPGGTGLLMEAICSTGIRSPRCAISLWRRAAGEAVIYLKGKIRTICCRGSSGRSCCALPEQRIAFR